MLYLTFNSKNKTVSQKQMSNQQQCFATYCLVFCSKPVVYFCYAEVKDQVDNEIFFCLLNPHQLCMHSSFHVVIVNIECLSQEMRSIRGAGSWLHMDCRAQAPKGLPVLIQKSYIHDRTTLKTNIKIKWPNIPFSHCKTD